MNKIALITGISGQDGAFLTELLLAENYKVFGTSRQPKEKSRFERLEYLGVYNDVEILDRALSTSELLSISRASEVYNLEGQSSVAASFEKPFETIESNGYSTLQWLESIRQSKRNTKFYQASSTDIFGDSINFSIDENSVCVPKSPYAVSKLFSHHITRNYREAYNIYACCGILSNHESALRGEQYVTQKIARSIGAIMRGELSCLEIGNLSAQRDWGHAKDYIRGMHLMMQQPKADDYILATGRLHTVRQLVETAFAVVGKQIRWRGEGVEECGVCTKTEKVLVKVNPKFYRPSDISKSLGSPLKAMNKLGWEPQTSFKELITEMVEAHL